MNSHVSSILLGVNDMERSKSFYTEGLGWKVQNDYRISVFFVPHGGSLVGFYGRDGLADMVGVSPDGSGFSGIVFNYVVRSEDRVDEILDEAKRGGGKILNPAAKLKWGGYGGSSPTPMATSGTSATAPQEKTSLTPSNGRVSSPRPTKSDHSQPRAGDQVPGRRQLNGRRVHPLQHRLESERRRSSRDIGARPRRSMPRSIASATRSRAAATTVPSTSFASSGTPKKDTCRGFAGAPSSAASLRRSARLYTTSMRCAITT